MILLINPPFEDEREDAIIYPPLGLAYLASSLEINTVEEVEILDFSNAPAKKVGDKYWIGRDYGRIRRILKGYQPYNPILICIGCFFTSRFKYALEVAKRCKKIFPNIPIVTGGIHASVSPEDVLKHKEFDYVIIGEGEEVIVKLAKNLGNFDNIKTIDSLAFRDDNKVVVNPRISFVDVNALPFPAWHLLNMEDYVNDGLVRWNIGDKRHFPIITSRGCPNSCTFCNMSVLNGKNFRGRSAKSVVDEIEFLVKNYSVEQISFEDDNLTFDNNRIINICEEIIINKLNIEWNTPNGVSVKSLNHEVIGWMKAAGCKSINLAIESGDEYILNNVMMKGVSLKKIREIVDVCHTVGIITNAYFVLGMPGETEETIKRTIDFACSLPLDDIQMSFATPFAGTQLYKECVENKYILENYDEMLLNNGFRVYAEPVIETPFITKQELLRLKKWFYIRFYFKKILWKPYKLWNYRKQIIPLIKYLVRTC
jgi:anaerobic magnesium-protoporphyrin IX monomethyl ester cyclase